MKNRRAWLRLLAPILWMFCIYLLSSVPDHGAPEDVLESAMQWVTPQVQNLLHIPVFGGLCFCWVWSLKGFALDFNWCLAWAFFLTLGFGCFDEWYQLSVPGRFGSMTDVVLNGLGALIAIIVLKRQDFLGKRSAHPVQAIDKQ